MIGGGWDAKCVYVFGRVGKIGDAPLGHVSALTSIRSPGSLLQTRKTHWLGLQPVCSIRLATLTADRVYE